MSKLPLGHSATCKITKFEGILTARVEYITGCDQYLVQPQSNGKNFIEPRWIDEARLNVSKEAVVSLEEVQGDENGADVAAPIK